MKRKIKLLILPLAALLSACQLFLGQEPGTSPSEVLKSLWTDFNNIHANLDFRMSNNLNYNSWHDVYYNKQDGYAKKVYSDMSENALFNLCANMLKELNDPHVALYAPGRSSGSYTGSNEYVSTAEDVDYSYTNFVYGRFFNSDIGYIYISAFINEDAKGKIEEKGQEWGRVIDKIIGSLANTKALVLDVRNNRGGEIFVMEYIAARFASEQKDYVKARIKTGPGQNDLSAPVIYTVKSISKASGNKYGYTKPIVLLTNKGTVSAGEWFTLALRTQKHVTHMGKPTCGALSTRNDRSMINGWLYSISPERVTDMNGKFYEGIGISPDEKYIISNDTEDIDKQLKSAYDLAVKLAEGVK